MSLKTEIWDMRWMVSYENFKYMEKYNLIEMYEILTVMNPIVGLKIQDWTEWSIITTLNGWLELSDFKMLVLFRRIKVCICFRI